MSVLMPELCQRQCFDCWWSDGKGQVSRRVLRSVHHRQAEHCRWHEVDRLVDLRMTDLPAGYPFKPDLEITPRQAKKALDEGRLHIVDCRTKPEVEVASIAGAQHIPLDELEQRADEIEPEAGQDVAVICHHGVRSMKATLMLRHMGMKNVKSIAGGIELWSTSADSSVPRYERGGGVCRVVK